MIGHAKYPLRVLATLRSAAGAGCALAALALLPCGAAAAALTTVAKVVIVCPTEASPADPEGDGHGAWRIAGDPEASVQLSLEWRTLDGAIHERLGAVTKRLDAAGHILADPADLSAQPVLAPAAGTPLTFTLVICRE